MTGFQIGLLVLLGVGVLMGGTIIAMLFASRRNEADFDERLAALDDELSAQAERRGN